MLYKTLEFKLADGQKIKITEIPVLGLTDPNFFMVQARLQSFIISIINLPQAKNCYSFRDHLKRKMKWSDFEDIFEVAEARNNA